MAGCDVPYYYDPVMTVNDPSQVPSNKDAEALLQQTAVHLRDVLTDLASRLRPFPAFMNMVSLQAIELEPLPGASAEVGCVVVLPEGEICELDLQLMPGIEGVRDVDTVEDLTELPLAVEDYITYASAAIRLIFREIEKRGA